MMFFCRKIQLKNIILKENEMIYWAAVIEKPILSSERETKGKGSEMRE